MTQAELQAEQRQQSAVRTWYFWYLVKEYSTRYQVFIRIGYVVEKQILPYIYNLLLLPYIYITTSSLI